MHEIPKGCIYVYWSMQPVLQIINIWSALMIRMLLILWLLRVGRRQQLGPPPRPHLTPQKEVSQFYRIWTRISPSLFLSFTVKGRAPYNFLLSYEYDDSITISPQPSESETLSQPYQTNIKLNLVPRIIYHITLPSSILTQLKE